MRVLILQAGNSYVDVYRASVSWKGTKYQIRESERITFDGRVSTPKKHLIGRVIRWVNERSDSGVKVAILPGKTLTPLLLKRIKERTLFIELLQPQYEDPDTTLKHMARHIRDSLSP